MGNDVADIPFHNSTVMNTVIQHADVVGLQRVELPRLIMLAVLTNEHNGSGIAVGRINGSVIQFLVGDHRDIKTVGIGILIGVPSVNELHAVVINKLSAETVFGRLQITGITAESCEVCKKCGVADREVRLLAIDRFDRLVQLQEENGMLVA